MTDTAEYADESIEALQRDVQRTKDDVELASKIAQQKLDRLEQAHLMRKVFFALAGVLATATVGTSVGMVIAVLNGADIEGPVAIAFISGLAAETVGVLAIMAGYLFPRNGAAD